MLFLIFLQYYLLSNFISSQPIDLVSKAALSRVFVSVGFTYLDDRSWRSITTATNQFQKDTAVFVTIPQIPGRNPAAIKMRAPSTLNADGTVSFEIKIVQPNDSYCSKSFGWIPRFLSPTQVAWMVFELGAYTIRGYTFIAGKGTITRASWSTSATFTNQNLIAIPFPTGCVSSTESCVLPDANRGAINLIQTNNNVKEVGKDLYLTVRSRTIDQRRGTWVLVPHDVAPGVLDYHILSAETLGYLAFPTGIKIECFEKMIWETQSLQRNYVPITINYRNVYDYPPGIFGMVGTITALCNTVLVSANWTRTSSVISINEDQCAKAEFFHTTPETIFLAVVGEQQTTNSTYQCYVNFNTALTPSTAPSAVPSFTPTFAPTRLPTRAPTANPTFAPTTAPTISPTAFPTANPTRAPTFNPTFAPTFAPTVNPTAHPTFRPSTSPTFNPTFAPTTAPTFKPTASPSVAPTVGATAAPTTICSNSFPVEMTKV